MQGLQEVTSFFMVSTGGEELWSLSPLVLQETKEYVASSDLPIEGNLGFNMTCCFQKPTRINGWLSIHPLSITFLLLRVPDGDGGKGHQW